MSKIVRAINAMVSNPNLIKNVLKGQNSTECFFIYEGKHAWSILRNSENDYYMTYYPGDADLGYLASISDEVWHEIDIKCVSYNSKDLGTKEAKDSMKDLFDLVIEKAYGMDDVLDDIISTEPF